MLVRAVTIGSSCLLFGALSLGSGDRVWSDAALRSPAMARVRTPAVAPPPTILRGRVLLPDDGSPRGLRAFLATPAYVDSADVDAEGGFAFTLPRIDCDSADIRIDDGNELARRYHSARLRIALPPRGDALRWESLRVLLVPATYTISAGTYAGAIVPIDVDAALAEPGEHARYWRVSRSEHAYGVPIGWPEEQFPLPVAVLGRSAALRGADSASVWAIARQLERDFGRTLFRPISIDSVPNEVLGVTLSLNPSEETPGITFITYDGRGELFDATIAIRSPPLLSDQRVVTHELLHALGFGHATGWHSVMSGPYQAATRATASDVAYAQLFYRLRRMHLEQGATHGILESSADAHRRPLLRAGRPGCPSGGAAP